MFSIWRLSFQFHWIFSSSTVHSIRSFHNQFSKLDNIFKLQQNKIYLLSLEHGKFFGGKHMPSVFRFKWNSLPLATCVDNGDGDCRCIVWFRDPVDEDRGRSNDEHRCQFKKKKIILKSINSITFVWTNELIFSSVQK